MIRMLVAVLALVGLTACTPTTTTIVGGANYTEAQCFAGPHVLFADVTVPRSYGAIFEMTQYANGPRGLEISCNLVGNVPLGETAEYNIYLGEIYGGQAGLCVSAVTRNRGHVISCASQAQVAQAVAAPLGSPASRIRFSQWQPFPGS